MVGPETQCSVISGFGFETDILYLGLGSLVYDKELFGVLMITVLQLDGLA